MNLKKKIYLFKNNKHIKKVFIFNVFCAIFLALIDSSLPFINEELFKVAEKHLKLDKATSALLPIVFVCVSIILFGILTKTIMAFYGRKIGLELEMNIRNDAIKHMYKVKNDYFDKTPTSKITSTIIQDARSARELIHDIPINFISGFISLFGGLVYSFKTNWIIGVSILGLFLLVVIFSVFFQNIMRKSFKDARKITSELSGFIGNQIGAISLIKTYSRFKTDQKIFEKNQEVYKKKWLTSFKAFILFDILIYVVLTFFSLFVIIISAFLILKGKITKSQAAGLITASSLLLAPFFKLSTSFSLLNQSKASLQRVEDFLNLKIENNLNEGVEFENLKGTIEFKNVFFRYSEGSNYILKDFSFKINQGEKIAFLGKTGIGKSTIFKLIIGLYEIEKGEILIDGISSKEINKTLLRKKILYIDQPPTLFLGSIKDNIKYANDEATEEEIEEALKKVQLDQFVSSLEEKLEYNVGMNGKKLSGGQRQRISIVRAFLKEFNLLLIDEITSALDSKTEKFINDAISELSKNKTTIAITHKLATIKEFNKIVVIGHKGKILEQGKHDELYANKKFYYDYLKASKG